MRADTSFRGNLLSLFGFPSKLEVTRNRILDLERGAIDKIGTWKCLCGHKNTIYYHPPPSLHPLGVMCCRACTGQWKRDYDSDTHFESHSRSIRICTLLPIANGHNSDPKSRSRILPLPHYIEGRSSLGYICNQDECGLTWLAEMRTSLFGRRRIELRLSDRRGKSICDCGSGIFQPDRYTIFEMTTKPTQVDGPPVVGPQVNGPQVGGPRVERVDSGFTTNAERGDDAGNTMMLGIGNSGGSSSGVDRYSPYDRFAGGVRSSTVSVQSRY